MRLTTYESGSISNHDASSPLNTKAKVSFFKIDHDVNSILIAVRLWWSLKFQLVTLTLDVDSAKSFKCDRNSRYWTMVEINCTKVYCTQKFGFVSLDFLVLTILGMQTKRIKFLGIISCVPSRGEL